MDKTEIEKLEKAYALGVVNQLASGPNALPLEKAASAYRATRDKFARIQQTIRQHLTPAAA